MEDVRFVGCLVVRVYTFRLVALKKHVKEMMVARNAAVDVVSVVLHVVAVVVAEIAKPHQLPHARRKFG